MTQKCVKRKPGYSLGFGRIVVYDIGSGQNPACKFLLVDPDGTRHYLGAGTWNGIGYALGNPIETSDGTHIVYTGNGRDGGDLHYPDGTKATFTAVNNRLLPTSLWDTNGNYVQIAYKDASGEIPYSPMAIDFIYDTLGRLLEFQYDSTGKLTSIDAPGFGGTSENPITNTLVRFDYQTLSVSYTFSGLTVERGASSQVTLKHIYYPATGTGYMPSYSQYGMVYALSVRRQMTYSGIPPTISDGVETANTSLNYPTSGSNRYVYSINDPINMKDPSGLDPFRNSRENVTFPVRIPHDSSHSKLRFSA